jgi:hypothetical protein
MLMVEPEMTSVDDATVARVVSFLFPQNDIVSSHYSGKYF